MERKLFNWLLLKGKEDWILEYVRGLSDNNLHITLKSFYFHCKSEIDIIYFDKKYKNLLLNEIEPIYLKYNKNSQEFIYGCENKIKEINQKNFNLILNQQSGELFLNKIWRNDIIKNEIISYLSIFKYHRFKMTFTSIEQIQKYKFKDYLDHVEFSFSNSSSNINVTYLDLISSCANYDDNQIISNNQKTLQTTITHLNYDTNFIIQRNYFEESITILKLGNTQFPYSNEKIKVDLGGYYNEIEENVLPSTLKSLTLMCQIYNKTIKYGCLPSSLEYLSFHDKKKGLWSFWSYIPNLLNESPPPPQPVLIVGSLPINLKTLKLSSHQSFLDNLISEVISNSHKSLTKLSIIKESKMYDYRTKKELSDNDTFLKFKNWKHLNFKLPPVYFQFFENDSLPITYFKTNSTWGIKTLPNTLKSISLKTQFDQLDLLYDSSFIPNFNHNILKCSKLVSLKILSLPSTFTNELNIDLQLPNLEILFVGSSNPKIIISKPLKSLKLKKIIIKNNNYNFIDNLQFYSIFKVYNRDLIKNLKLNS
ncbi:hypothetical protein ACTFIZ_008019 [Dictyostelium cf. discoideum]